MQSVRAQGAETTFASEPPIVISSSGPVLIDAADPYASALARVLATAAGDGGSDSLRSSGSSAIAAALARQQAIIAGTVAPTIVYQSSKPKPTAAPNKDKVITSVRRP